jgi:UDP-N-acetylmuramoylalanine--D-glutamate ligase
MESLLSRLRGVPLCGAPELAHLMDRLDGMPVTLAGLGLFGGGVGAARFLAAAGADLTITDLRTEDELAGSVSVLEGLPVRYRLGEHVEEDFTGAALVVASPAVPRDSRFLLAASQAGVPVTSPMNLFVRACPARIAGVTGSNGKSTTTTMLAGMVRADGHRVWLGGNLGGSLLPDLGRIDPRDTVVLELSSFQLQDASFLQWSPHVAVVTNVSPNHLDRHGTMADYVGAKEAIFRFQGPDDCTILNAHDRQTGAWLAQGLPGRLHFFDSEPNPASLRRGTSLVEDRLVWRGSNGLEVLCTTADLRVPGLHNVENALAAAAAARCLGCGAAAVREGVRGFSGLEHRLELVAEVDRVRYYNDSNSTTPASSIAAVRSFDVPVVLIAGGYDKKLDLKPLACAAVEEADVFITMGATGPRLAALAREALAAQGGTAQIVEAQSLAEAVAAAAQRALPGAAVVFSPGCASYDMFANYEVRGKAFRDLVRSGYRAQQGADAPA